MAQRVSFASIPNTQAVAYWQTICLILGEVRRSRPDQKALREFLRMRNLFDKEGFSDLAAFIDLSVGDPCSLGPFAVRLLDAPDDATARELLADRLIAQNPLLAKYCLEAMDTEHGGRLHSTNELYRMITSYVYPGVKPTLNSFKSWVEWAVAAGLVKMVGIRWALAEKGVAALPRLRAIDAEEFLEAEREAESEAAPEPSPEEEIKPAPEPVPAPAPEPEPAGGTPPQPATTPQPAAPAPAAAPRPAAAVPGRVVRPIAAAVERPYQPAAVGPEQLASDRDALVAWHDQYPGRRPLVAAMAGVDLSRRTPMTPLEAAFGALLLAKGIPPAAAQAAMDALRTGGVLLSVAKGRYPVDAVAAAMAKDPDPGFVAACEATVHLPRLLAGTSDPGSLLRADDPRAFLWGLWRRLYEPVAPLAPFYLARFLGEAGMLAEALVPAGLVPTFTVRENAFRIGYLDRLHAGSFADLLEASVTLARWFGPPAFEGPLSQVHEGFGCAFRCGRAAVCPLSCREKGEVAAFA